MAGCRCLHLGPSQDLPSEVVDYSVSDRRRVGLVGVPATWTAVPHRAVRVDDSRRYLVALEKFSSRRQCVCVRCECCVCVSGRVHFTRHLLQKGI